VLRQCLLFPYICPTKEGPEQAVSYSSSSDLCFEVLVLNLDFGTDYTRWGSTFGDIPQLLQINGFKLDRDRLLSHSFQFIIVQNSILCSLICIVIKQITTTEQETTDRPSVSLHTLKYFSQWHTHRLLGIRTERLFQAAYPQSSSTLWNYSKCGVYTVESEAGC
jgi:hypothetical protein